MSDFSDSDLSDEKREIIEAKENTEISEPQSDGRVSITNINTSSNGNITGAAPTTNANINCTTNLQNTTTNTAGDSTSTSAPSPFVNTEEQPLTPGRAKLHSWLYRTFRILLTDGRILSGAFLCTDADANIILGMCFEDTQKGDEQRMLGLVMVPGRHIVKMEIDMSEGQRIEDDPLAGVTTTTTTTTNYNSSSDEFQTEQQSSAMADQQHQQNDDNVEIATTAAATVNNKEIFSTSN